MRSRSEAPPNYFFQPVLLLPETAAFSIQMVSTYHTGMPAAVLIQQPACEVGR